MMIAVVGVHHYSKAIILASSNFNVFLLDGHTKIVSPCFVVRQTQSQAASCEERLDRCARRTTRTIQDVESLHIVLVVFVKLIVPLVVHQLS